jgi:GDPmannose 4,6-dehydratase
MLQQESPEDFVISTGEMHSVREFVEMSFSHINKTIMWEGKAEEEVGIEEESGKVRVKINKKYYRPTEVVSCFFKLDDIEILLIVFTCFNYQDLLLGDSSKASKILGWKPSVSFPVS